MEIKEILLKEPGLAVVFDEAKAISHLKWTAKIRIWSKELKPKMSKLVGFYSKDKDLNSCEIYDKVYSHCAGLMEL